MKYFTKEEKEQFLLSDYLKMSDDMFKKEIFKESDRLARTKYLIEVLGDAYLDIDTYKLFIRQFQSFGGPYSVLVDKDTIKGIYEIYKMYPFLTAEALGSIWYLYIRDLFEEYELPYILELFIKTYGMKDDTFEKYLSYIEKKGSEHQKIYDEDALKVSTLQDYSKRFCSFIESLILRKHYTFDKVTECIPEASLIKKDEAHLLDIEEKTRIFMGACLPVSYIMVDELLKGESLEERPAYYASTGLKEEATFTKEEFLQSIKKKVR